jgi:hypothetical protein
VPRRARKHALDPAAAVWGLLTSPGIAPKRERASAARQRVFMKPIFFLHITKTAGGTVKEMVRNAPVDVRMHYPNEPGYSRHFEYDRIHEVYFGHFFYGAHAHVGAEPRYAAFLREPLARTVSHYYHLVNHDAGKVGDVVRSYPDLKSFLKSRRRWEFDNFMCRVIAGTANQPKVGHLGEETYQQAIENLRRDFLFIGLFEDLENSLARLNRFIPVEYSELPHVNKGRYRNDLDTETVDLLTAANHYDQRLYQEALSLVQQGTHVA